MTYSLLKTPKGWVISVTEKRKTCKYFLWDVEHTKQKYIKYILSYGEYRLGEPFGNNIYPIYLNHITVKKIDEASKPVNILTDSYKKSKIWSYYRSFITDDTPKKVIKQYANELQNNLELLGLDGLFQFVQAQA